MQFRKLLQYLLVKKARISNKNALRIIRTEGVLVNDMLVFENIEIGIEDTVKYNNITLKKGIDFVYLIYHKPRGVECTMNIEIADNLIQHLPVAQGLFHMGRLDKESEGLLLLTNDGSLHDALLRKENNITKKYIVTVNELLTTEFLLALQKGIVIMHQLTLPAFVKKMSDYTFSITLTQGLNRQIRRMCYKYNYSVQALVRVKFANLELNDLQQGKYKYISKTSLLF
jgi:23S rRNA pseudouridine2604 synthase